MALNLHVLANRLIRQAVPNTTMVVIRALPETVSNSDGTVSCSYGDCELILAQQQSINGDEPALANNAWQDEESRKFYLSALGRPLSSGDSKTQEPSSYLYEIKAQRFWRIYSISEDFQTVGWALVFASLQASSRVPLVVKKALAQSGMVPGYSVPMTPLTPPLTRPLTRPLTPASPDITANVKELLTSSYTPLKSISTSEQEAHSAQTKSDVQDKSTASQAQIEDAWLALWDKH